VVLRPFAHLLRYWERCKRGRGKVRGSASRLQIALIGAQPKHRREFARWLNRMIGRCSIAEFGHAADLGNRADADASTFDLAFFVVETTSPEMRIDALNELVACAPEVPVLALSDHAGSGLLAEAIGRGARGCILTSMQTAVTRAAIKLVLAGGIFVPATMLISAPHNGAEGGQLTGRTDPRSTQTTALRHRPYRGSKPGEGYRPASAQFTRREAEVLAALQEGKQNKTIARELGIRESTVKVHVARLMRKLNVTNRTQIACLSHRLVPRHK
jgi:DNA-binding NarL/FixJ family response regulator